MITWSLGLLNAGVDVCAKIVNCCVLIVVVLVKFVYAFIQLYIFVLCTRVTFLYCQKLFFTLIF